MQVHVRHADGRLHAPAPALIQPKLRIGTPGDAHEREADRVADRVLAGRDAGTALLPMQAYARQAPGPDGAAPPSSVERVVASPGAPLQPAVVESMAARFGYDFSRVRVHLGPAAERSARDLRAEAYTVGHHVVFGAGRFAPATQEGRSLLAHELTHVVQQSHGASRVQRLIRTPYPWRGVIVPARGANVRSSPDSTNPANILDAIPKGQAVTVIGSSGDWLRIQSRYRGPLLAGFVHHTLVDDAASASMAASVGETMVWRPSGPGSGTDFESWASAAAETPFPAVSSATVMNCWEAVLLSAYRARAIDWNWIHNLYVSTPTGDWEAAMSRGARTFYAVPGPNLRLPQRGDLVFFNGLAHVALATGNGSEVYTFWPPPNTPFTFGGTTDKVKVFTIEDLVAWWAANLPPQPIVEFAAPAW
ncbi:MAG: DUF4157 domain-containing protein [Planctomycetota bacterium]|nr:MAG: DUF4157 domain-containing protein [Planctomycetota bacterium]